MRAGLKPFLLASFLTLMAAPALAANPWTVDTGKSHLTFTGTEGSAAFQGSFKKFTPVIDLDPANPQTGTISVTIDMTSATAGSSDRDAYLPQPDWFDTKKFPTAQFVSTAITKTGEHDYLAAANLTIKGVSVPVQLPFTLVNNGGIWEAKGKLTLMRPAFHIGEHEWASDTTVKFPVDVMVDIVATPGK
jgi:polyisoprenoid-binding protein YceI